jgi:hypothetical protein
MSAKDALDNARPLIFEDEWAAIDELRFLAATGEVRTRAKAIRRRCGGVHSFSEPGQLNPRFWITLNRDQGADSFEDWKADRFGCRLDDEEVVEASGVQFCVEDLQRWLPGFARPVRGQPAAECGTPIRRGRRPAHWWPDVLEEALVDHFENGWPEGEDTQGVEVVIERLLKRLAERGIEPSRASLQGPIRGALMRCRIGD